MTIKLSTKLLVSTLAIGSLFLGGTYLSQSLSEKRILTQAEKEKNSETLQPMASEEDINTDEMTIKTYYNDYLEASPKVTEAFAEKFGADALTIKMQEMFTASSGHKEKFDYISALYRFYQNSDQPILAKNEVKEKNKEGDLEVVLNEHGEYSYSLETELRDVNALSPAIDSAKAIKEICQKNGIDPDGKIGDLTPELILEIDEALFTISDHPKN